jgi:hypothetical protein
MNIGLFSVQTAIAKAPFNKKKAFFISKLDLNLGKKLVT